MADRGAGGRATSKRTPVREAVILEGLRQGMAREEAAEAAQVSRETVRRWIAASPGFAQRVAFAQAECERDMLRAVKSAADSGQPNTWQAAAWWLERTRPGRYGQRSRIDISMDVRQFARDLAVKNGLDESELLAVADGDVTQARLGS